MLMTERVLEKRMETQMELATLSATHSVFVLV